MRRISRHERVSQCRDHRAFALPLEQQCGIGAGGSEVRRVFLGAARGPVSSSELVRSR